MRNYFAVTAAAVALLGAAGHAAQDQTFPTAAVKIWDTALVVPPSISLGQTPGESIEDADGLTRHGTGSPTIVTTYANGTHPRGRAGIAYWNPDANVFTWYGKTVGFPSGITINRAGPTLPGGPVDPGPDLIAGTLDDQPTSFGPGDVWVAGDELELLYVHIAGTDLFRSYGMSAPIGNARGIRGWGVAVDPATGFVFLSEPEQGRITRLDPVTGRTKVWLFGGRPGSVVFDRAGNFYSEISSHDLILRVNRDDTMTVWRVPAVNGITPSFRTVPPIGAAAGLPGDNPNGMLTDPDGNLWFLETNAGEIGRLSGGADGVIGTSDDQICEFTSPGLLAPQQIAVTGVGPSLQVYFTEGDGNSVSVLTQVEANAAAAPARVCTPVPAEPLSDGSVFEAGSSFFDEMITPLETVIIPTIYDVAGTGEAATGAARTADGKLLPPILRFSPMPNPASSSEGTPLGDAGNGFPSGLTGVYAGDRVAGTYIRGNKHFELESGAVVGAPTPLPPTAAGRMVGGGTTHASDGAAVNHGIALNCAANPKREDILSVTWRDNEFKLTAVRERSCADDPAIATTPFDTHSGSGTGRYNGAAATVEWLFTDAGKGGDSDVARILIKNAAGIAVLDISGTLAKGDHSARTK